MHLASLKMSNFRKFGCQDNTLHFVSNSRNHDKANLVAGASTLIVGKNNAGKTTVTEALKKILAGTGKTKANDFNFSYLKRLLRIYQAKHFSVLPKLEFELVVGIEPAANDLLTNVKPFVVLGDLENDKQTLKLNIRVTYQIEESEKFREDVKKAIEQHTDKPAHVLFRKFMGVIENSRFVETYYDTNGDAQEKGSFRLKELFDIVNITASHDYESPILARTFNKIVKYRYENGADPKALEDLEQSIDGLNEKITTQIDNQHREVVNNVLHKIESDKRLSVSLSSDLTFEKLMATIVKYEYSESGDNIPEAQFGLGYKNLMNIIGQIIDHIERFPNDPSFSKIHIICIEEPETHMHPQMQELFIKHINDAVSYLLSSASKNINSQLIVTTHSSHILNSKIHSNNSFDDINYITIKNNFSHVVSMNDQSILQNLESVEYISDEDEEDDEQTNEDKPPESANAACHPTGDNGEARRKHLDFLKKHIKFKVSEIFFSDAVIFVEGVTEETLLPFYLDRDDELKRNYITVFNIGGAHGQVYLPLIKLLNLPVLIITDLDIKRSKDEKREYRPIQNLNNRTTTNSTLKKFNGGSVDIGNIQTPLVEDNIHVVFQGNPIGEYYATSFEEAFILTNYQNTICQQTLHRVKRNTYYDIVGKGKDFEFEKLPKNAYKLQKKMVKDKSEFANETLFRLITAADGDKLPSLPTYISEGLSLLKKKLPGAHLGGV